MCEAKTEKVKIIIDHVWIKEMSESEPTDEAPDAASMATARLHLVVLDNKQKSPTRYKQVGDFLYVKESLLCYY